MTKYTAITFAPVQGFIEKSRKLRDLYGASLILSYLSQQIVSYVRSPDNNLVLISPALPSVQKGMPNRILIKGEMTEDKAKEIILSVWKEMLRVCQEWIERNIPDNYHWEREWSLWGCHTWEIFQGSGCSIKDAMEDLETKKLSRDWNAVNWIGESSSLTGTDGIAFPGMGAKYRNPKTLNYGLEDKQIKDFYTKIARKLDNCPEDKIPEGKFIAPNEKLSIPELVKRLVTLPEIANLISKDKPKDQQLERLKEGFQEIDRKPEPSKDIPGQWTGWFMGDGDKVGDHLKKLAEKENGDDEIHQFSDAIRNWGKDFGKDFPDDLGRIVYAGGDDFLGIIYSKDSKKPVSSFTAYEWLKTLKNKWEEHKQEINVSVGFVWVAGSVPQRDVLQHCREAEKVAKSLGRDRVTIRVVFNSGQYVQWTCPWDYLGILKKYQDRDGKTFTQWEENGRKKEYFPNWGHVYGDLATLKARHAINLDATASNVNEIIALELFDIYFGQQKEYLENHQEKLVGNANNLELMKWIDGLINIGWYLCSNI